MRARSLLNLSLSVGVLALPMLASAQTLLTTLAFFNTALGALVGLFITLAIVVFFWGLIMYLWNVDEKKQEGLSIMLWGVIAIFVMVSIWGIVRLLQQTFKVTSTAPVIPSPVNVNLSGY